MVSKSMVPPETGFLFEGVCLNYRHPDPRRVWKGGSDSQLMTPDPLDRADLADPVDWSVEFQMDRFCCQARYLGKRYRSRVMFV